MSLLTTRSYQRLSSFPFMLSIYFLRLVSIQNNIDWIHLSYYEKITKPFGGVLARCLYVISTKDEWYIFMNKKVNDHFRETWFYSRIYEFHYKSSRIAHRFRVTPFWWSILEKVFDSSSQNFDGLILYVLAF